MKTQKDKYIDYINDFLNVDYEQLRSNLQELLKEYERKSKRLDKIISQSDKQQRQLIDLNEELNIYKNHLEEKVEIEIAKRKEKEKLLFQQSKLAAMGEMMDAVAHQWKQPINVINMRVDMIEYDFIDEKINEEYIKEFKEKVFSQVTHMTNTLDEFRSFFRPNKSIKEFNVKEMIEKVLLLVKDEFMKNRITVKIDEKNSFSITGIENEFKHLILNIINNAKDAFNEKDIQNRQITITIYEDEISKNIEILDNAGGIPEEIIEDIFKAHITTKEEGKGTGIGLYMSSQIAQKHHGTLKVENHKDGANFKFQLIKQL